MTARTSRTRDPNLTGATVSGNIASTYPLSNADLIATLNSSSFSTAMAQLGTEGYTRAMVEQQLKSAGYTPAQISQIEQRGTTPGASVLTWLRGLPGLLGLGALRSIGGVVGAEGAGAAGGASAAGTDIGAGAAAGGADTGAGAGTAGTGTAAAGGAAAGGTGTKVASNIFGKVAGSITDTTSFLAFIAWMFYPGTLLRAIEFMMGIVTMAAGLFIGVQYSSGQSRNARTSRRIVRTFRA